MAQYKVQTSENKMHIEILKGDGISTGLHAFDERLLSRWRARELVSLLVSRREPVKNAEIAECIYEKKANWHDINSVHVLVCRIRCEMEATVPGLLTCILNQYGSYQWNMEIVEEMDAVIMQELCQLILQATNMDVMCWARVEKLLNIYQQAPFEEYRDKKWAQSYRREVKTLYCHTVSHVLYLLRREGAYERIQHVCQRCVKAMPEILSDWNDLAKTDEPGRPLIPFQEMIGNDINNIKMHALYGYRNLYGNSLQ